MMSDLLNDLPLQALPERATPLPLSLSLMHSISNAPGRLSPPPIKTEGDQPAASLEAPLMASVGPAPSVSSAPPGSLAGPPIPPPQTAPSAIDNFKIARWQNRNFDSGVQTMVQSEEQTIKTPSLMSLHPSEMSSMSSVVDDPNRQELTDQQRCRFERLSLCRSRGGYESSGVPELIDLMRDEDEAVVQKAVCIMQNIAKRDSERDPRDPRRERILHGSCAPEALQDVLTRRQTNPGIVRAALGALFHLCSHPEGLKSVVRLVVEEPAIVRQLLMHITPRSNGYKYAILSLHSILSDREAQSAVEEIRRCRALAPTVAVLRVERNEKLLPIIVDLVRVLCEKSNEQKTHLMELGGVQVLLEILSRGVYENLLWRTTRILSQLASLNPHLVAGCGAREVLHPRLAHASERLVLVTLECLRTISIVPAQGQMAGPPSGPPAAPSSCPIEDCSPVLAGVLRLFGHANPTITLYAVQTLSNMVANNRLHKEFMVKNNGVSYLLRALMESSRLPVRTDREAEQTEEMQESLLCCLRQLCSRHSAAGDVCTLLMEYPDTLLERLVKMRPALLRETMLILRQTCQLDSSLPAFRSTRFIHPHEHTPISFIHQLSILLRVSLNQLPLTQPGVPYFVENVKVSELVSSTLWTMASLCRDRQLLEETVHHLLQPVNSFVGNECVFLPIFCLLQVFEDDREMKISALKLIEALSLHPQTVATMASNVHLFHQLQHFMRYPDRAYAYPAGAACMRLFPRPSQPPPAHFNTVSESASLAPSYPPPSSCSLDHSAPGPSGHSTGAEAPAASPIGAWPDDLPLDGDPFANVFCSPSSPNGLSPSLRDSFDPFFMSDGTAHCYDPPSSALYNSPESSSHAHLDSVPLGYPSASSSLPPLSTSREYPHQTSYDYNQ